MIHTIQKNKSSLLFISLFVSLINCAHGLDTMDDAGIQEENDSAVCRPPQNAPDDWCTSGNFGGPCLAPYSDNTKNSRCTCGQSDFPCGRGTNCRFGVCVESDLAGEPCEFDGYQTGSRTGEGGDCDDGYLCIEGHCTFYECTAEKCDGIDNDCDGMIDEADDELPLRESCLGNNRAPTEIFSPCLAGRRECLNGGWSECIDDVPPLNEQGLLACDGVDNDCDTCIDGVLQPNGICIQQEPRNFDVVFIFDISGSMNTTINSVITAVNNFTTNFANNPSFKFGIVLLAKQGIPDGQGTLYLDLTDFNTFTSALSTMPTTGGGEEPQWDVIYELATGELQMSWTPDAARIIVLFTDEVGQTTRAQRGLPALTETDMCNSLTHGEVLAFFTDPMFAIDFDDCGMRFNISDSVTMEETLESEILVNPCE